MNHPKKSKKKLKLYRSCDTLSMYNFDQITRKNDFRYLIKGLDPENDNFKPSAKQNQELYSVFKAIMLEYTILSGSSKLEMKIKSQISIKRLEINIQTAEEIINIFSNFEYSEVLVILNKLDGFEYDESKGDVEQITKARSRISGLKTKLTIKDKQFKKKYESETKVQQSIFEEATIISQILGLKHMVDVHKSISYFVGLRNLCKNKE